MDFASPVQVLPGVGPVRARQLAEAGYETVGDLLFHLPHRYEDRRSVTPVAEALAAWRASPGGTWRGTLLGCLEGLRRVRVRRRGFSLVRGRLRDASGALPVVWFNRPYLPSQVEAGVEYLLHGELRPARGGAPSGAELVNPSCEPAQRALHGGRVVPVYPAAGPLGPALVRRLLGRTIEAIPLETVPDPLPPTVRRRHALPALGEALGALHLPGPDADADELGRRRTAAHGRLIYGELLELQLALARVRRERGDRPKGHRYLDPSGAAERFREIAPFDLTGAQRRVVGEILADLGRETPMSRLLQGDVGSGKTVVAALALAHAVASGLRGAFMAPTELLAEQHHRNLVRLLGSAPVRPGGGPCRIALLTGSNPEAPALRRALARGEVDLAVGTHALIQEEVEIPRLGLAVIDEQHRFGVVQRRALEAKGERPDVLVMTATPIPRSLALTAYGDLDLSVIDELPPGRRPVATELWEEAERRALYREVARELAGGGRAYVVCPRIEAEGDGPAAPSLEREGEEARRWLGRERCAVLHGRMSAEERDRTMAELAAGAVRVLVATTVIEVGVDVSEATVMVIEGADRFGLAQLHQLRGRVGRGERPSRCLAVRSREATPEGRRRLEVFAATADGFEIAEADLRLRGFGELLGTRQAGLTGLRVADPAADAEWLARAREDARELAERWDDDELAPLRAAVERRLEERRRRLQAVAG